ncbi:uncharacterized protein LOC111603063 [Drosophila hydei]|uniref:Uncharacterized protein LOC111603063 n=1 Tax=Drosophila hydei TaxID=7224 RepID=A0A6J1MAK2_DROHY|nr:uncharacterized protein LOC111603063 [Drosophila hydei]
MLYKSVGLVARENENEKENPQLHKNNNNNNNVDDDGSRGDSGDGDGDGENDDVVKKATKKGSTSSDWLRVAHMYGKLRQLPALLTLRLMCSIYIYMLCCDSTHKTMRSHSCKLSLSLS